MLKQPAPKLLLVVGLLNLGIVYSNSSDEADRAAPHGNYATRKTNSYAATNTFQHQTHFLSPQPQPLRTAGIYLHKSLTQHLNKQPVSNKTIKMLLDLADPPLITHQPTSLEIMTLRCFTKVRTGYQGLRS